ncbi:ankyrin repeat protein [Moumouvirus australiensis]|uniref:Ankyrin repeat protein n=1 Tax=Moumouvirus australiensis TaxID=2109587 RepID=A0A2P1EKY6_9VIRU|nr:ankyrin repeat protein [Moumouvirus australiensis]AVL94551.1 ankyrin repeat protein [Moumouvirus australiensis]
MYFLLSEKSKNYYIVNINYVFEKMFQIYRFDLHRNINFQLIQVEPNTTHSDLIIREKFPGYYIVNHIKILTKYNINDLSTITMLLDQNIKYGYKKFYQWVLFYDKIDILQLLHQRDIPLHKYSSDKFLRSNVNLNLTDQKCIKYILVNNDFFKFDMECLLLEFIEICYDDLRSNVCLNVLKFMLENDIKFNHQNVFFKAVKSDAIKIFEFLHKFGFDINLAEAIKYCTGNQIFEYILKNEKIEDNILMELLNNLCKESHTPLIKLMIKYGIDVDYVTEQTLDELVDSIEVINLLIKKSDKITYYVVNNCPGILSQLMHEHFKKSVIKLIKFGIDINYDYSGNLSAAFMMGDLDIVKLLTSEGIKVFTISDSDLEIICGYPNVEILKFLIDNGFNINIESCLIYAILYENIGNITYLLEIVDYYHFMAKIIINYYIFAKEVYFLNQITKPFSCSPIEEIIMEIIRGGAQNAKKLILDYDLHENLEIAFVSCFKENIGLIDFLLDCNADNNDYINWLFIFSTDNMTTFQYLLKKINLENISKVFW